MIGKDGFDGFRKCLHGEVWLRLEGLIVAEVDKDGAATRRVSAIDVAPAVTNHPTTRQIDAKLTGRIEQHARKRLASWVGGRTSASVVASLDMVDGGYELDQVSMEPLHYALLLSASANVRLVGGDNQQEASGLQPGAAILDAW